MNDPLGHLILFILGKSIIRANSARLEINDIKTSKITFTRQPGLT